MPLEDQIPGSLPPQFDAQLDAVNALTFAAWELATREELQQAATQMGLVGPDGTTIVIGDDSENARLVEWTVFHVLRQRRPLIEAVANELGRGRSPREHEILTALRASRWSLLRIEAQRQGVGALMHDLWSDLPRVVFSRALTANCRVGDHLLARCVTVAGCTTVTAFIVRIPIETVAALASQRLPSGRTLAQAMIDDPTLREEFIRHLAAAPAPERGSMTIAGGNRARNQPCPCGSGLKFKVCCGRMAR